MKLIVLFSFILKLCFGQKPHVVIIVADDLGWNDLSFHGSDQIPTPNLDALAYSGIILQNYYTLPLCTPSRAALMTGIHPIHTGMYHDVIWPAAPWGLPLDVKILPQYLKADGYKTHAIGKWHLGYFKSEYIPTSRGFDDFFGYYTEKEDYYSHVNIQVIPLESETKAPLYKGLDLRNHTKTTTKCKDTYATNLFTKKAVQTINSHNTSSPLFLYLAHLAVHSANMFEPLQAPRKTVRKFKYISDSERRTYAAMVTKLDESVGEVVATLAARNMLNNTIIIFTTDNGGPADGFHQSKASNWPLRGIKSTLWEGGVRGNAIIWSQQLPASKISNSLMHIQDWVPTILAAVNSSIDCSHLDGHNMWPVLQGDTTFEYDELLLNKDPIDSIAALRKGDWKLVQGHKYNGKWDNWYGPSGRKDSPSYNVKHVIHSLVAQSFQFSNIPLPTANTMLHLRKNATVVCPEINADQISSCSPSEYSCLYNVRVDPCEINNLAYEEQEILHQMIKLSNNYKPVPPLNKPNDPRANPKFWHNAWTPWMDSELNESLLI